MIAGDGGRVTAWRIVTAPGCQREKEVTMSWQVGYPEKYQYLDDEHVEMAAKLQELRDVVATDGEETARRLTINIARMLRTHIRKEDQLMQTFDYPERELHKAYHAVLIDTLTYVLQSFDHKSMAEYGGSIAQHIENKLSEEVFVDGLFAEYLRETKA